MATHSDGKHDAGKTELLALEIRFERIFDMQIWLGPELARSRFVWKLAKQIMLKGG